MSELLQEFPANDTEELSAPSKKGGGLRPYWRIFQRKAWLIASITSLTSFAALLVSSQDPYTYTGSFYLLVEPITSAGKLADPTTLTRTGGVPNEELFALDYPTNLAFLQSPGMKLKIAQEVQAKLLTKTVPAIWKDLRENLAVNRLGATQSTATKIFEVSYTGEKPQEVQSVLDIAAETYLKYSTEEKKSSLKSGIEFINKQLPELEKRVEILQSKQEKLRKQYDVIDPTAKGQDLFIQVNALTQQQLDIQNQLKSQKALYTVLQKQLKLKPEEALAAASLSQDPSRQALLANLQQIESQIAVESANFAPNSPPLQALENKRQNLLTLLNKKTQEILQQNSIFINTNSQVLNFQDATRLRLIEQMVDTANQIEMLEINNQALIAAKQQTEQQAQEFPKIVREYNDLDRQITLAKQVLDRLLLQRETLKVEAAQDLPWQLLNKPQIPLDADGTPIGDPPSRMKKLLAGVAGGLFAGMGLAILLEKRRGIFYSAEDIQDATAMPLLAEIPLDDRFEPLPDLDQQIKIAAETEEIQDIIETDSSFLNSFDYLYTQLSFLYSDTPIRSLIVSSIEPGDGQSTIAFNLAKRAAAAGQRVLLVDANLRHPQIHNQLNLSNYKGLSELLTDQLSSYDIIERCPDVDNLFVLTAGSPGLHSPKKISVPRMQHLMKELKTRYDLIIYDPPHFLESMDASFLASNADGIMIVVSIGKTRQSTVKKAINQINNFHLPSLGVVANSSKGTESLLFKLT